MQSFRLPFGPKGDGAPLPGGSSGNKDIDSRIQDATETGEDLIDLEFHDWQGIESREKSVSSSPYTNVPNQSSVGVGAVQGPMNVSPITCPPDWMTRENGGNIFIQFYKDDSDQSEWCSWIEFRAKDVARLMREGLYWSPANVQREKGWVTHKMEHGSKWMWEHGYRHSRSYALCDLSSDPQWIATIWVHAREVQTLVSFDLTQMTSEMTMTVSAQNWDSKTIYEYDRLRPHNNFNAIYDDMVLEGAWPWPKKEKEMAS